MVQEGETPSENPVTLIDEYLVLSDKHRDLVAKIAHTNAETVVEKTAEVVTLLDLLHERAHLIRQRNLFSQTADVGVAGPASFRYGRNEIKSVSTVDVVGLRHLEESRDEEVRVLDARIQQLNWETELL